MAKLKAAEEANDMGAMKAALQLAAGMSWMSGNAAVTAGHQMVAAVMRDEFLSQLRTACDSEILDDVETALRQCVEFKVEHGHELMVRARQLVTKLTQNFLWLAFTHATISRRPRFTQRADLLSRRGFTDMLEECKLLQRSDKHTDSTDRISREAAEKLFEDECIRNARATAAKHEQFVDAHTFEATQKAEHHSAGHRAHGTTRDGADARSLVVNSKWLRKDTTRDGDLVVFSYSNPLRKRADSDESRDGRAGTNPQDGPDGGEAGARAVPANPFARDNYYGAAGRVPPPFNAVRAAVDAAREPGGRGLSRHMIHVLMMALQQFYRLQHVALQSRSSGRREDNVT